MKPSPFLFLALIFLSACHTPKYFAHKGNYDKAIEGYSSNLRAQKKHKKNKKDLIGLESSFALVQNRDVTELAQLQTSGKTEDWPRINALHRQIQSRQKIVTDLQPLQSRKGYRPQFILVEDIDSLQEHSRRQAAAYLYEFAQNLLSITASTGQRQPARDAYTALKDLKTNYFLYWENTNALLDSAYQAGKAHILFETSVEKGVPDGSTFWESVSLNSGFVKNEWLVFYTDPAARAAFDFRAKCRLVSLFVGIENTSCTIRTECKQVEDGYDEKRDSSGCVVSRTVKYRTELTPIPVYSSNRNANGTVLLELIDEHSGQVLSSRSIQGVHNFEETSEMIPPSAPTSWGMIYRVADSVRWDLRSEVKRVLVAR